MKFLSDKKFGWFVLKFILIFCFLYFGTIAVIGFAAPGNHYSPFIDHYFDYVSGIKNMLLYSTKGLMMLFGIETTIFPGFIIRFNGGKGVLIAMDCVGYGVYSFWLAFTLSNDIPWKRKTLWALAGVLLLFFINVIRISLFLDSVNHNWPMPLGIDHHTWFNIFAYAAIFGMIVLFDKKALRVTMDKNPLQLTGERKTENKL